MKSHLDLPVVPSWQKLELFKMLVVDGKRSLKFPLANELQPNLEISLNPPV
jgi:hypothetical protein